MTFYRLATELEQIEVQRRIKLFETTTMDAISFIPAHLGVVKARLKKLSKEKKKWGIEVLENEDSKELRIENRLRITVPNEYWENFRSTFSEQLGKDFLDLDTLLSEAIEDEMKDLRKRLKPALVEMYNGAEFKLLDTTADTWRSWFGAAFFKTKKNRRGAAVSYERKGKDIQALYGKLLRAYGNDKGNLEMLLKDIQEKRPLNAYDVFKYYDFLYGTRIQSSFNNVSLIFEAVVDMTFAISQSIYVSDDSVLDSVEEQTKQVKRVEKVLYPTGGRFSSKFFRMLKETIEDVVSSTKEQE